MLAALPEKFIINRRNTNLFWTFREYFASKSFDVKKINPDYCNHFLIKTFLLCLDVPDVFGELSKFWKEKI